MNFQDDLVRSPQRQSLTEIFLSPGVDVRPKLDIVLSDKQRTVLEELARQRSAPHLEVIRAKALLMASEGHRNVDIAQAVGIGARTITIWRGEFRERGLEGLKERRRSGRPRAFPP